MSRTARAGPEPKFNENKALRQFHAAPQRISGAPERLK
jgi:hypothetical protein